MVGRIKNDESKFDVKGELNCVDIFLPQAAYLVYARLVMSFIMLLWTEVVFFFFKANWVGLIGCAGRRLNHSGHILHNLRSGRGAPTAPSNQFTIRYRPTSTAAALPITPIVHFFENFGFFLFYNNNLNYATER